MPNKLVGVEDGVHILRSTAPLACTRSCLVQEFHEADESSVVDYGEEAEFRLQEVFRVRLRHVVAVVWGRVSPGADVQSEPTGQRDDLHHGHR